MEQSNGEKKNVPVEAVPLGEDRPGFVTSSSLHRVVLLCNLCEHYQQRGFERTGHLPPKFATFRLSKSIAFEPSPSLVIVSFAFNNSLPS